MEEISLHVDVEVNPTESEDKVKTAVTNVLGEMNFQLKNQHESQLLLGEAKGRQSLAKLCELLRREHIRSAARRVFIEGAGRNAISFCLNKQVATTGHISFSNETAESPLGPIKVTIKCSDPREIIEWLTSTSRGES